MTLSKRILDMLPALIVFACVAAFGTYVAVAYVVRDPWWMHTLATHASTQPTARVAPRPGGPATTAARQPAPAADARPRRT